MQLREWDIDDAISTIETSIGLELFRKYEIKNSEFEISLRPSDIPVSIGFRIFVSDDYLGWAIRIELDEFALSLMKIMRSNYQQRKDSFHSLLEYNKTKYEKFIFQIDGVSEKEHLSSVEWLDLELDVFSPYYDGDSEFKALEDGLRDTLNLILLLCTASEIWTSELDTQNPEYKFEGSRIEKTIQTYERSRFNRSICLEYYGFMCRGCGNILEEIYGPIGAQVIHVHHIVPVSQMNGGYVLNPIKDLIPLCPNCHNIVHQQNPPLAMESLKILTGFMEDV
jgi:5-methylcytosine-specific restriction protein A